MVGSFVASALVSRRSKRKETTLPPLGSMTRDVEIVTSVLSASGSVVRIRRNQQHLDPTNQHDADFGVAGGGSTTEYRHLTIHDRTGANARCLCRRRR